MRPTSVFKRNLLAWRDGARYIVNQGGTSSSKTYSILQLLLLIAAKRPGILISVVSESLPHLKRGAMRDFINIMRAEGMYSEAVHNKSSHEIKVNQSSIQFFPADQASKLRGARRDVLFINEANNITYESFMELAIRTKLTTFLDFNPVASFWVHENLLDQPDPGTVFIKSTFRDNDALDPAIRADIESRRERDPYWWQVYGMGEVGNLEGVILTNWSQVDAMPETPRRCLGIDFGFTNDPTAVLDVRYSDGDLYWDELLYQTGITTAALIQFIKSDPELARAVLVCDSAEPRTIAELNLAGLRAVPAEKGPDSVRNGIDTLLQRKLYITKRSTNVIKEARNYRWRTDRDGRSLNVPVDMWNHGIDGGRYGSTYLVGLDGHKIRSRIASRS